NLDTLDNMQRDLLHQIPELLYIGIVKNGTTYHIDAVEKMEEKKSRVLPNQNLVATKDGVIKKLFIKNGMVKVAVNDVVEKGDILVSGTILTDENEDSKRQKEVAAEG